MVGTKSEGSRQSLYAEVTARVIAELEEGRLPWVCPWDRAACECGMPRNAITGRAYSGINIMILGSAVLDGGYVTKDENGTFVGQLKTLIRAEIAIQRNTSKASDAQPDYRVVSGDVEIGAGWNRHSKTSGRDYVSLSQAAPEFGPRRLYANLGRAAGGSDERFAIIWNPAD